MSLTIVRTIPGLRMRAHRRVYIFCGKRPRLLLTMSIGSIASPWCNARAQTFDCRGNIGLCWNSAGSADAWTHRKSGEPWKRAEKKAEIKSSARGAREGGE